MLSRLRARLTYANVMATVAVFIALGGSSYAALNLPKNAVGAAQLKTGSVRASEVKNGSLGAGELTRKARASLRGQQGATGLQGPKGDKGDKGDPATTLWAVLNSDGTLRKGSGVVSVSGAQGTLWATVKFNRNIDTCAILSSIGRTGAGFSSGETVADEFVANGFARDSVLVRTGDPAGTNAPRGVHLAVFC
jgi:hypothetical protein